MATYIDYPHNVEKHLHSSKKDYPQNGRNIDMPIKYLYAQLSDLQYSGRSVPTMKISSLSSQQSDRS